MFSLKSLNVIFFDKCEVYVPLWKKARGPLQLCKVLVIKLIMVSAEISLFGMSREHVYSTLNTSKLGLKSLTRFPVEKLFEQTDRIEVAG